MAVRNLTNGDDSGTTFGQSATELISFHNATPVDQAAAITLASGATITTVVSAVRSILTAIREKGLIAT